MHDSACKAPLSRRRFLQWTGAALAVAALKPNQALAQFREERRLALYNAHTGESLHTPYWAEGHYLPAALTEINHLLRDHRTDQVSRIDPKLLDFLFLLQQRIDSQRPFRVLSAYRSPQTNAMLRRRSNGVAKRSLHMEGRAIDINLPGYSLAKLRQAALSIGRGGVGYYPQSWFIHLDTGRVRYW